MRLLQAGVAKSGNYLLYTMLTALQGAAGMPPRRFITGHPIQAEARQWKLSFPGQHAVDVLEMDDDALYISISSLFREPITDIPGFAERTNLVWTHAPWARSTPRIAPIFDHIVYVIRDPRDAIISHADFLFTDYMRNTVGEKRYTSPEAFIDDCLEPYIREWGEHISGYLDHASDLSSLIVVFYENIIADRPAAIAELARDLGLVLPHGEVERIAEEIGIDRMRAAAPGHVNKGQARRWAHRLTPEQQERARRAMGAWCARLNYPEEARQEPGRPGLESALKETGK